MMNLKSIQLLRGLTILDPGLHCTLSAAEPGKPDWYAYQMIREGMSTKDLARALRELARTIDGVEYQAQIQSLPTEQDLKAIIKQHWVLGASLQHSTETLAKHLARVFHLNP